MLDTIELSVILPAYLEAENLRILLPRLHQVLGDITTSYEIIVVDTQTALDFTPAVCAEHTVIYLNRENGNAFGDAIRTGIAHSQGKYIILMDADGSHEPEFIKNLWSFRALYDVIIASRYITGGITENPFFLILLSRILNVLYSYLFNLNCKDVSNSFKLYCGEKLRSLKLKCNNFDIVEEILIRLNKKFYPLKIKEIPFVFRKRMFGITKRNLFLFMISYLFSIVRLIWQTSRKEI